ncbi:hypothetical protein ACH4FX_20065 [Streptomyces sp. NPDC018019]
MPARHLSEAGDVVAALRIEEAQRRARARRVTNKTHPVSRTVQ